MSTERQSFWQMPSPWVWTVFLLSMLVFVCSMLTWSAGQRFQSRPLRGDELALVGSALDLWKQEGGNARDLELLRQLLESGRIRAMDKPQRSRERATFGYTDERGRILLNPELCFAYQRALAGAEFHRGDQVAVVATLYHELQHLTERASEPLAYEREWELVQCWFARSRDKELRDQLLIWDQQMAARVAQELGPPELQRMRLSLERLAPLSAR